MKTAALLPIHDDPLSLRFWLEHYEAVWAGEVDELVILISGPNAADVPAAGTHIRVIRHPGHIVHTGDALEMLVASTDADVLMFCEDDAYVRQRGVVATNLAAIANDECDVIGSPREPCSEELWNVSRGRFGAHAAGVDEGNALWPCFLFIRAATLARTNGKIGPTLYQRGEYVAGLDYTVQGETASDETFVGICWQLRADGARIRTVPQYRLGDGFPPDVDVPWFHVGSLSSGAGLSRGALEGDEATNLRHITSVPEEFTKRIAWWRRFADSAPASETRSTYSAALDHLVEAAGLREKDIGRMTASYDWLVNW